MNVSGDKVMLGRGLGKDGLLNPTNLVPKNVEQLQRHQEDERLRVEHNKQLESQPIELRGPASLQSRGDTRMVESKPSAQQQGINILSALKQFEIALRTNDKEEIQSSIDQMDSALTQVVNSRAQVGARVSSLTAAHDSLQKGILDSKATASQLEDADLFEVVSDITKADSTLKATLETSGKVMNMSLMDFLK